ncbi:glucokinase [Rhodovulum iodosum]|uniref:Glucokinase n=1 Tax=Rhodovulum iodosum TaxID=68291 RepID=A0ABV3XUT0_9RHOB|nr:glucokinase [Rhodovulum robiginosum]RSK35119.1 glucokinase [Rhodovulum robiginosum]
MSAPLSLVADIGGTNTRVALAEGPELLPGSVCRYRNADHAGLAPLLAAYLAAQGAPALSGGCFALAGPVRDGVGRLTNLDWTLDEAELRRALALPHVTLLNDLQAQGHALDHLAPDACVPVIDAPVQPGAPRLVVGVGTGFNAAPVYATGAGLHVPACEAGHVNLPVDDAEGQEMARFVAGADGFAAVEDVLSGRGLEAVHAWVTRGDAAPRRSAAEIIAEAADSPEARAALTLFAHMLGRVTGNLGLTFLPFGGLYLTGGVARAVTPHLEPCGFTRAFRAKGRFSRLLHDIAVFTVEDDFAALTGCAGYLSAQG